MPCWKLFNHRVIFLLSLHWSMMQEEELFETTSEEESGSENGSVASAVIDVEDLGKMVGHMKKAQVITGMSQSTSCFYR